MRHDPLWRDTEVVHTYTRAHALADGALIDISPLDTEAGFRYPVAVTAAVWQILEPSDDLARLGQSATGRAWDVLQVLRAHRSQLKLHVTDFAHESTRFV